jgi:hypothetical protein
MSTNHNNSKDNNKDYDNGNVKYWSHYYLVDNIFNDLMSQDNKYIIQAKTKFNDFRRKSPVTFFDIHKDFKKDTKRDLELYVRDCNSKEQAYRKLDGIITEVIALIYRETRPLILSTVKHMDLVWMERAINEIRSCVSKKWRLVGGN